HEVSVVIGDSFTIVIPSGYAATAASLYCGAGNFTIDVEASLSVGASVHLYDTTMTVRPQASLTSGADIVFVMGASIFLDDALVVASGDIDTTVRTACRALPLIDERRTAEWSRKATR